MAKIEINFPKDITKKLDLLGSQYSVIAKKMLRSGMKPLKKQVMANLKSVIGQGNKTKPRSKGNLIKAVITTKPYKIRSGEYHMKIGIYGYDKTITTPKFPNGVPHAVKANALEHGRSNMPAKPWLKPAIEATKNEVMQAMIDKFDEELKKL